MDANLPNAFIEQVIRETISGERIWCPLTPVSEAKNPALFFALFETEWHHIRYDDSYYLPYGCGFIFLISELTESGRDGTLFDGINLYIQPTTSSELTQVIRDCDELYRLKNAIADKSELPPDVVAFMRTFLES